MQVVAGRTLAFLSECGLSGSPPFSPLGQRAGLPFVCCRETGAVLWEVSVTPVQAGTVAGLRGPECSKPTPDRDASECEEEGTCAEPA